MRGGPFASAEKRSLKMPLVRGNDTGLLRKSLLEMFGRLEEWISLPAHGRGMLAPQRGAHRIQSVPAAADDAVDRLQGKRQAQDFCGGLDRRPGEQFQQQGPQQPGREGVARQHAREEQREGFPAATTLATIRTEYPLAPDALTVHHRRIVAAQYAVAVQRAPAPAVRTAPLLERKSTALNSLSSRIN